MNRKQLTQLLVLVIVVLIVGLLAVRGDRRRQWAAASARVGETVLPGLPLDEICRVEIRQGGDTLELERGDSGWGVVQRHGYRVNLERLRNLLRDLAELKVTQNVNTNSKENLAHLELLLADEANKDGAGVGALLILHGEKQPGKPVGRLIFGREHLRRAGESSNPLFADRDWPVGRYLRNPDSNKSMLVGKTFSSINAKPAYWLDKEFFKVEDVRRAVLRDAAGAVVWEVSRPQKDADLVLAGLKPDEEPKAELRAIGSTLRWITLADVADPQAQPAATGMDKPMTLEVEDFEDFVYTLKVGALDAENRYHLTVAVARLGTDAKGAAKDQAAAAPAAGTDQKESAESATAESAEPAETPLLKLARLQKNLSGWTFLVNKTELEPMLRERSALAGPKPAPAPEAKPEAAQPPETDSAPAQEAEPPPG